MKPEHVRQAIERNNASAVRCDAAGDIDSLASWGEWLFELKTEAVDVSGRMAIERGKYVPRFRAGAGAPPGMRSKLPLPVSRGPLATHSSETP